MSTGSYFLIEVLGFASGIAGVWLTIRQKIAAFPAGILNVLISAFLFYSEKLYADTLQQFVYLILIILAWKRWSHRLNMPFHPRWLPSEKRLLLFWLWICGGTLLGGLLMAFTDASFPWTDSFASMAAFIAQGLIITKKKENWLLWMGVNLVYFFVYLQKDLYLYAGLSLIYLYLALKGHLEWKRS